MTERDRVLEAYRNCISEPKCKGCPWTECKTLGNGTIEIPRDLALAVMRELVAQEPGVMTLEEINGYLDDPDGDKKPLWLEWHYIPDLSGWVLASQVSDLMKRYMDYYNSTWRPWTSRPTDEQRKAAKWDDA